MKPQPAFFYLASLLLTCSISFSPVWGDSGTQAAHPSVKTVRPKIRSQTKTGQVRELITPAAMTHESGVGYVARLKILHEADSQSRSTCILLEDGQPLPHPHALHKRIRETGKGHYSHWTPTTLYFSTSDSSDPRTNGRKYELVCPESYTEQSSQFVLTDADSLISFPDIPGKRVQPVKLVWENRDPQQSIQLNWKRQGAPDLSSQQAMLASILKPGMTDEEKSMAIWKFLVDWRYHFYPAEPGDEVHDPVKFLNVYGYGFCDDCASNFAVLARKAGVRSRTWGLSGHVVAEAFYDGKWHMFDPDHEVFYRNDQGVIASVEELAQHPELITKTPLDPIGSPSQAIARLYTTTADNRPSERKPAIRDSNLAPTLEPGDRLEFDYIAAEYIHRRNMPNEEQPPVAGNGTLKRSITKLESLKQPHPHQRDWHFTWPYVLLKGALELKLAPGQSAPTISVSSNGTSWTPLETTLKAEKLTVSLEAWIKQQPTAVYGFYLRCENTNGDDPAASVAQLNSEFLFQFAPRALAHMQNTNNHFEMKLSPPLPVNSQGLAVQLEWKVVE
ncbi:transglutaminase-like domain-containing protein [Gimesia chilikensis]|uniref:transglutaminase-like domain-containing protein n=1 Tax=Gimesia chilikensis TaxID=2605989 RepID=UPI003A950606